MPPAPNLQDASFPSNCPIILQSPFRVNFFWGTIPEPSRSHDAVSFMNVLHHAAKQTVPLLRQAADIARHFILITEDIDGVTNRNLLHAHDPQGIFRSDAEWKQLFERELPEFSLRRSGGVMKRRPCAEGIGARTPRDPADYSPQHRRPWFAQLCSTAALLPILRTGTHTESAQRTPSPINRQRQSSRYLQGKNAN